jgi:spore germination protein YaaH
LSVRRTAARSAGGSSWVGLVVLCAILAAAPAAQGRISARSSAQVFLLSSSPDSLPDLERHASQVGVVYPTYFDCQIPSGRLLGRGLPVVSSYAHAHRLRLMPRFNCQDGATVHRILTIPSLRQATLQRLLATGSESGYGGICLDLENDGAADRTAMTSFVTSLASGLHARHRRLTVVVDGVTAEGLGHSTDFYDDRAIGAVADSVFVLAWGAHWAGSGPGPIAPLTFVSEVGRFVNSLANRSRFVLGTPMYGLDWVTAPGSGAGQGAEATAPASSSPVGGVEQAHAYQYSEVIALAHSVGATPRRDPASQELTFSYTTPGGISHEVWYMDAHSVAAAVRIARASGLEVGLWRLGSEDQRIWSAIAGT